MRTTPRALARLVRAARSLRPRHAIPALVLIGFSLGYRIAGHSAIAGGPAGPDRDDQGRGADAVAGSAPIGAWSFALDGTEAPAAAAGSGLSWSVPGAGGAPATRAARQRAPNRPPSVTLIAPTSPTGFTAPAALAFAATASDSDGAISRVEFYQGGNLLARCVAEPYAFTWTAAPCGTYVLTAKAVDDRGESSTSAPVTVSVGDPAGSVSLFGGDASPRHPIDADRRPVELGMKFHSDVPGRITGLKYYKTASNGGTHVGHLWRMDGTLLGSVEFTGEAASGWQQARFAEPIDIAADATYIASYHTDAGHYAGDNHAFADHGVERGPLHVLADGVDGPTSVFTYGSAPGFPTETWKATNYWVDVVFSAEPPAAPPEPTTPAGSG